MHIYICAILLKYNQIDVWEIWGYCEWLKHGLITIRYKGNNAYFYHSNPREKKTLITPKLSD